MFAFGGISSKLEIIKRLSLMTLEEFKVLYSVKEIPEMLTLNQGYFFNNLFAKMRYFSTNFGREGAGIDLEKHVHLCLISLKDYAPE